MADYTLTHTGAEVDSAVTKGLLIPTPASSSDAGKVPTVNSGGTGYELTTPSAGMTNPMTSQGDIIIGGASGAATRLAKGSAGQVLTMNSGATAPKWVTPISYVEVVNGYTVTAINNSGYPATIYDGTDDTGTVIGTLNSGSTGTYTITSGYIYAFNSSSQMQEIFVFVSSDEAGNPLPVSGDASLTLITDLPN